MLNRLRVASCAVLFLVFVMIVPDVVALEEGSLTVYTDSDCYGADDIVVVSGSVQERIAGESLKFDLFAWTGPQYMRNDGSNDRLKGAFDLNAGLEFKITKNLNLWTQFNNIFNKQYQRWNQYPVYGFNFVGGVVFSFDQKNR